MIPVTSKAHFAIHVNAPLQPSQRADALPFDTTLSPARMVARMSSVSEYCIGFRSTGRMQLFVTQENSGSLLACGCAGRQGLPPFLRPRQAWSREERWMRCSVHDPLSMRTSSTSRCHSLMLSRAFAFSLPFHLCAVE